MKSMEGESETPDQVFEPEDFVPDQIDPTLNEDPQESVNDREQRVEYFCGFGRCRPKCLQVFRSVYCFTFLICCDIFIEGALATGKSGLQTTNLHWVQLTWEKVVGCLLGTGPNKKAIF